MILPRCKSPWMYSTSTTSIMHFFRGRLWHHSSLESPSLALHLPMPVLVDPHLHSYEARLIRTPRLNQIFQWVISFKTSFVSHICLKSDPLKPMMIHLWEKRNHGSPPPTLLPVVLSGLLFGRLSILQSPIKEWQAQIRNSTIYPVGTLNFDIHILPSDL